jgi:cyclophilin family peptidyl-prolyl cis-trans isomerase
MRKRVVLGIRSSLPLATVLALSAAGALAAQRAAGPSLSRADSALIGRILLAEDRRDSTDAALAEGMRHGDPRVRVLARRAAGRIRDPHFAGRDSLPPLAAPETWPEPGWLLRFRALMAHRRDCAAIRVALADSKWPVRLRAADLADSTCAADAVIATTLRDWIDHLPTDVSSRRRGGVSWHAAAHAMIGLARMRPEEARARVEKLSAHPRWQLRMYAARALGLLRDSARLRELIRDPDDNVKEAAILALRGLTGHADDSVYALALEANGAQAVRAAAAALEGTANAELRAAAFRVYEHWKGLNNASARDARLALLAAAGRAATADEPPSPKTVAPPPLVALALGQDVRLRVTMAASSGGGAFVVRLRGDAAPMMAARVLALVRSHYYDGLEWHRVEPDFVIQGGSPGANEYVGYADYFRDELGTVPHVRGTVGMSTRGHDSGDAQWFVNLRDNLRLGRDYTVFGEVIDGMDVVDGILEGDTIATIEELPTRSP